MSFDFASNQPSTYTELELEPDGVDGKRQFQVPIAPLPCFMCGHHEPFGENTLTVWCSLHRGHVPAGATCALWSSVPPPDQ